MAQVEGAVSESQWNIQVMTVNAQPSLEQKEESSSFSSISENPHVGLEVASGRHASTSRRPYFASRTSGSSSNFSSDTTPRTRRGSGEHFDEMISSVRESAKNFLGSLKRYVIWGRYVNYLPYYLACYYYYYYYYY